MSYKRQYGKAGARFAAVCPNTLICVQSALFFEPHSGRPDPMVTIRLTRRGARNQPFYHVVVTDSRKRQGGKSLELVGFFNPTARKNDPKLRLDLARIDYWLGKGAQPSERVANLAKTYRKQAATNA